MKNTIFYILTLSVFFTSCDEVYNYEVKNTTWDISIYWEQGFSQGEPDEIVFYDDGTTSWGGSWNKTDELTFKWTQDYMNEEDTSIATYYAMFRKDLNELTGRCISTKTYFSGIQVNYDPVTRTSDSIFIYSKYEGDFFAYKKRLD